MKKCVACGIAKPLDDFAKSSSSKDGRQYRCRPCSVAAARQWQIDHPDRAREIDQRYRKTDGYKAARKARREGPARERILEQKRASYERNRPAEMERSFARERDPLFREAAKARYVKWKEAHPRGRLARDMQRIYGLTLDQWDFLVLEQTGRCAVCNDEMVKPHVDHDHITGIVRGLLCTHCNTGLGHFKDDPQRLQSAIRYLTNQQQ